MKNFTTSNLDGDFFSLDIKGVIFWNCIAEDGSKVNRTVLFFGIKITFCINYHADSHSPWFFEFFCYKEN